MTNKTKRKEMAILASIALFQIALMVLSTASESYIISGNQNPIFATAAGNFFKSKFKPGLNLLAGFLAIKQIGFVSAVDYGITCCEKKINNGGWCVETSDSANCDLGNSASTYHSSPSLCSQTSFCRLGTCVIDGGISCIDSTPQKSCEEQSGVWDSRDSNLIQQCLRGACVFLDHASFETEAKCKADSADANIKEDFRQDINTESKTIALSIAIQSRNNYGACVSSDKSCKFVTGAQCENNGGNFFPNYLCTNSNLKTLGVNCQPTSKAECLPNKDEIYFMDSCGNPANIYDSSKTGSQSYWETTISSSDSCGAGLNNAGSTSCGNCARILGSACHQTSLGGTSIQNNNLVCKDLGCTFNGEKYKNGESWCVYSGAIGEQTANGDTFSADTVGSEHAKMSCIDGGIKTETIGSGRAYVCIPKVVKETLNNADITFRTASLEQNFADLCISYNPLMNKDGEDIQNSIDSCNENQQCYVKEVSVTNNFHFKICAPKYPKGGSDYCSIGTISCPVIYQKNLLGAWEIKKNSGCQTGGGFAEKMNNLCVSLGDCGSYVNFAGAGTDNVQITKSRGSKSGRRNTDSPDVFSWTNYAKYANEILFPNQKAVSGVGIGGESGGINPSQAEAGNGGSSLLGDITIGGEKVHINLANVVGIGGLGVASLAYLSSGSSAFTTESAAVAALHDVGTTATTQSSFLQGGGSFASYSFVAGGAIIGATVGNYIAEQYGISGDAADLLVITGGIYGAQATYSIIQSGFGWGAFTGWGSIVFVVALVYVQFTGAGQKETRNINFICLPWQAPRGGADCGKCNANPLIPCTQYMCQSLGRNCKLENTNTESPICISTTSSDVTPPVLSLKEIDAGTYSVVGNDFDSSKQIKVSEKASGSNCVRELSEIPIILETDEVARCKFSLNQNDLTGDFGAMKGTLLGDNSWKREQNITIDVPSLAELDSSGKLATANAAAFVACEDYYGNVNLNPYKINFCVESGPDVTPPAINSAIPSGNSYLSYGTTSKDIAIFMNEPGSCRYNPSAGISFGQMSNAKGFECRTDNNPAGVDAKTINGYSCDGISLGIASGTNHFYIRCQDESGNSNSQDYPYTLMTTKTPLKIDSISLSSLIAGRTETINSGGELKTGSDAKASIVNLKVSTSGGLNSGNSNCSYHEANVVPNPVEFSSDFPTRQNTHVQSLNLPSGDYNFSIVCSDDAGNSDSGSISFSMSVDSSAPAVLRAYNDNGRIKLLASEDAKCFYSFDESKKCTFTTESGIPMSASGFSQIQTASIAEGSTYYIKCEDIFENKNSDCAIQINPGFWQK